MHDAQLVQVFDATDDLLEEFARFSLFELLLLHDVVEEFAATDELHDQEKLFWSLNDFKELDDVRVSNEFENVDLTRHSLHICIARDLALLEDFDSHLHNNKLHP